MPAFSVSRSIRIDASPEAVFEKIRHLKSWPEWSPWLIMEPECEVTYAADGNSYAWEGEVIGSGELAVTSEEAPREIRIHLSFLKPHRSEAEVRFKLAGKDGGTEVTWIMDSSLPFFLFFLKNMMTTMIGMDYERGLAMLKALLENGSVPTKLDFGNGQVGPMTVLGVRTSGAISEIGDLMSRDMGTLHRLAGEAGVNPSGPPMAIYHRWAVLRGECEYTLGVPVSEGTPVPDGLSSHLIPETRTYVVKHTGAYRFLGNAWSAGFAHQRAKRFAGRRGIEPFEIYVNDPEEVDEKDLVTDVHFPMR